MENIKNGLVSVIMPAYNCAPFLKQSVESVKNQTYGNWELLLVDDGSTDGTAALAEGLAAEDGRIHVFHTKGRQGPAVARNTALENASGEYAAFLDSDDLWLPEKLEKQLAFMQQTGADFSCTGYMRISEDGKQILGKVRPFPKADYNKVFYMANPVGNSTAIFRRTGLEDIRVPMIRKRNDFALWLAVLKRVDFAYGMSDFLGCYRVRQESVSSNKWNLLKYQWELYHHIEKKNIAQCALAFLGLAYIKIFHPTWVKK